MQHTHCVAVKVSDRIDHLAHEEGGLPWSQAAKVLCHCEFLEVAMTCKFEQRI